MPVFESKYINSDADYLNLTQMNHNASTLQAHMKPCQSAIEIPDISEGLNKRAVITDESGNYLRVAMLSDFANYYTKKNLQTSGESEIHRGNLIGYENPFYLNEFVRIRADGRHYYLEIKGVDDLWHTKQHFWQD